jgi:hypothetical protein
LGNYDGPGGYGVTLSLSRSNRVQLLQWRDLNYCGDIFHPIWTELVGPPYGAFGLTMAFDQLR